MELTPEQQQALKNLTKVFSLTASQKTFNGFFQDDIENLKALKERQDDINEELKDLMRYDGTTGSDIVSIMGEFSSNVRGITKINNRLQMARDLLVELGINLV